jgi:hypothetical protein
VLAICKSVGWSCDVVTRAIKTALPGISLRRPSLCRGQRIGAKVDPLKALELSNAGLSTRQIAISHFPNASHIAVHRAIRYARKYPPSKPDNTHLKS